VKGYDRKGTAFLEEPKKRGDFPHPVKKKKLPSGRRKRKRPLGAHEGGEKVRQRGEKPPLRLGLAKKFSPIQRKKRGNHPVGRGYAVFVSGKRGGGSST